MIVDLNKVDPLKIDPEKVAKTLAVLFLIRDYASKEEDYKQFTRDIITFCKDWLASRRMTS